MQADALELLHPRVLEIVLDRGWGNLYPIQRDAIHSFRQDVSDFVIAAPTSGGKTEAAFLPVISDLMGRLPTGAASIRVLCISPLKSLINDQQNRVSQLCKTLSIAVHRWHGDVDTEIKRRIREKPSGIL